MVRLEEVEDEAFVEKPESSKDDVLLADDDADYTDTDSEISDASDLATPSDLDETLLDRIYALRDIVPPQTRAKVANITSSVTSVTSKGVLLGGKGLWVVCTSVLLLGLPYALAFQDEQMMQEEERQRALMNEGAAAGGFGGAGDAGEAKAAL